MSLGERVCLGLFVLVFAGCADGAGRGAGIKSSDGAIADGGRRDAALADAGAEASFEPLLDGGRPDASFPADARPRDGASDGTTPDAARPPDAGGCVPGAEVCNGQDDDCDFAVDEAPVGGSLCGGGEACEDGVCTPASACPTGMADCDGSSSNGCEHSLATPSTTCAAAVNVGSGCGDVMCDWFCPPTDWSSKATRRGRTAAFFAATVEECSGCCADLTSRVRLSVPAGVDYDLYVYRSCGGELLGSSRRTAGQTEEVVIEDVDDCAGVTNVLDYRVEVRYVSGASCAEWSLTFDDRTCTR